MIIFIYFSSIEEICRPEGLTPLLIADKYGRKSSVSKLVSLGASLSRNSSSVKPSVKPEYLTGQNQRFVFRFLEC